jgi:tRNA A22 N-methylase
MEKRYKQLNKRLSAIAELVREGVTVCDVGTDHAFLPCELARSGKCEKVYASDLNPKPLEFAKSQIEHQGADVTLLLSNGLDSYPVLHGSVDIIIAGMGGELIAEIVEGVPKNIRNENLRLILQPMTKQEDLRTALLDMGYEIILEKKVSENNRIFTIIYGKLSNLGGQL